MDKISFAFFGSTEFSKKLLLFLIDNNYIPKSIFSSPPEYSISYSDKKIKNFNYENLNKIAKEYSLPFYEVDSVDGKRIRDFESILKNLNLDLIIVAGWYYKIPKIIRELSKLGAWGIHASLLPKYAGGAPLTWAIINGEKQTGVTLFKLDEGIDDGDIISQKSFAIDEKETIKEVYEKATFASKEILINALKQINKIEYTPQDKTKIKIYPQRSPDDGEIDLGKSRDEIYNFIRAQSAPYPGAFIKTKDGKKLIIEKVRKK